MLAGSDEVRVPATPTWIEVDVHTKAAVGLYHCLRSTQPEFLCFFCVFLCVIMVVICGNEKECYPQIYTHKVFDSVWELGDIFTSFVLFQTDRISGSQRDTRLIPRHGIGFGFDLTKCIMMYPLHSGDTTKNKQTHLVECHVFHSEAEQVLKEEGAACRLRAKEMDLHAAARDADLR